MEKCKKDIELVNFSDSEAQLLLPCFLYSSMVQFRVIAPLPEAVTVRRKYKYGKKNKSVALQALKNLGLAEQPPLAVFPDCTRRYWVDMWSAH
jgi:hypothetical protein